MCNDVIQCVTQGHTYCVGRSKYCSDRLGRGLFAECVPISPVDCEPWPPTPSLLRQCYNSYFRRKAKNASLTEPSSSFDHAGD